MLAARHDDDDDDDEFVYAQLNDQTLLSKKTSAQHNFTIFVYTQLNLKSVLF